MQIFGNPQYWQNLSYQWRQVAPPIRPSGKDIKIYEKFLRQSLKNKKEPKILILGATPEMRDLAAKFNAQTTVCDISVDMIMAMAQLMKNKKAHQKEIWIKGSWVNTPFKENYYDAVLGDGVASNVSWQEYKAWWNNIYQSLNTKGVFVSRIFYALKRDKIGRDEILDVLLARVFKKMEKGKINLSELNILLLIKNYDKKTNTYGNKYRTPFLKEAKKNKLSDKEAKNIYQNLIKVFPEKPQKSWREPTQKELEKEFNGFFKVLAREKSPSFPVFASIYNLKKNC